jgi:hypothetical protein
MKRSVLSDKELLQAYHQAQRLNLDKEFISMIKKEIQSRKLSEISKTPDVLKEGAEKVHFFKMIKLYSKKRALRIASKARFLSNDTFKYHQKSSVFLKDHFFSVLF